MGGDKADDMYFPSWSKPNLTSDQPLEAAENASDHWKNELLLRVVRVNWYVANDNVVLQR